MKQIIIPLIWIAVLVGQFKSDIDQHRLPRTTGLNQTQTQGSLLDPNRFSMNHGFSMSLLSMGGQPMNINTYTNQMTYLLNNKTWVQTDVAFVMPSGPQGSFYNQGLQNNIYYRASLGYKPLSNMQINFSIEKMPTYYYRPNYSLSPFHRPVW